MHKRLIWLAILAVLVACGGDDEATMSQVPLADEAGADSSETSSPREAPGPGLPPTWTPAPPPSSPATPAPAEQAPVEGRTVYRVQAGDTLGEIAERFGVSLTALAEANRIENIDIIEVDQELIIPGP